MIPPPSGPAAALLGALRRARVPLLIWLWITAMAWALWPQALPRVALLLPAALLAFSLLADALEQARMPLDALLWTAGLGLALLAPTTPIQGRLALTPGGVVEAFEDAAGRRCHLGGPLKGWLVDDTLHLSLGLLEPARLALPLTGGDGQLGRWSIRLEGRGAPSTKPTHARLSVGLKDQPIEAWRPLTLGLGQRATREGVEIMLEGLSGNYAEDLGPAARIRLRGLDGESTAWRFARNPQLDARYSPSKLGVLLLDLEAARSITLHLEQRVDPTLALAGWGLMGLGLLLSWRRRA